MTSTTDLSTAAPSPPRYEVITIHGGTDSAIFLAPECEDPEWTMTLEDARELVRESGRRYFEFLDEVYDEDQWDD